MMQTTHRKDAKNAKKFFKEGLKKPVIPAQAGQKRVAR
jgi:hypothetical protein